MSLLHYIQIFIVFSIIGWIIDTAYRSVTARKYSSETNLLFNPAYGTGALVLTLIYGNLTIPIFVKILVGGLLLTAVEFAYGAFYQKVFGKRFWDYSKNKWNFRGHIDALHSFYWIILAFAYWYLGKEFPLY